MRGLNLSADEVKLMFEDRFVDETAVSCNAGIGYGSTLY